MRLTDKIIIVTLGLLLTLNACENPVNPNVTSGFTTEDETNLGNMLHQAMENSTQFEVLSADGLYADAYNYLNRIRVDILGTNYMENRATYDWKFYIILNDNLQDCFTTVGGKIYVTTGLLRDMVTNKAQLMGVLAHEVFYADQGYHMNVIQDNFTNGEIFDVIYGGGDARALSMIATFYNQPRNAELIPQADQYGATIMCIEGNISIQSYGDLIDDVAATTPLPEWYSNHPTPSNSSVADRKGEMYIQHATCSGASVNTYYSEYQQFLNVLPPR